MIICINHNNQNWSSELKQLCSTVLCRLHEDKYGRKFDYLNSPKEYKNAFFNIKDSSEKQDIFFCKTQSNRALGLAHTKSELFFQSHKKEEQSSKKSISRHFQQAINED